MFNFFCNDNESVQLTFLDIFGNTCNKITGHHLLLAFSGLDCEQSLFFFRFSESNARARERQCRETRETRAISHARGHLRISRFARRTTEKREAARSLFQGLAFNCRGSGQCGGLFLSKKRNKNGNIAPVLILPVLAFQLSLCESLVPLCSGGTLNILPRLRP